MIRIYCDTNIFSNLESVEKNELLDEKKKETYSALKAIMDEKKETFSFFFSHAHIRDKEKADDRKLEYFKFMERYVGDNYINYDEKCERPFFILATPTMVYDLIRETATSTSFLENDDQNDDIIALLNSIIKSTLSNFTVDIPPGINEQIPEKYQDSIRQMLPIEKRTSNLYEVMTHFTSFSERMLIDNKLYKDLRAYLTDSLHNGRLTITQTAEDFEENFKNSILQKTFFDYVNDSLYQYNDKSKIPYHYFYLQAYNTLDMFGISKDKLKKKNTFNNILNDAFHSYYGQYCDLVITEDGGMTNKSSYLYKQYSTSKAQIISPEIAIKLLPLIAQNEITDIDDFIERLFKDINEGELLESGYIYKEGDVFFIKTKTRYFNYFDAMLYFITKTGQVDIEFIKTHQTILTCANYREIEKIVNKCFSIFGIDINQNCEFDFTEEVQQIKDGIWKGRGWMFSQKQGIFLQIDSSKKQLSLGIGPFYKSM